MHPLSRPRRPRRRPPPSDRDQALYLQYSLSGMTQAQMAAEHGLTQSRVSQILRRVRSWLAEHQLPQQAQHVRRGSHDPAEAATEGLPVGGRAETYGREVCGVGDPRTTGSNGDQRQALAERLEYERLDHLFREAIRNFDRQQPTVTTQREGTFGRTPFSERTVRELPRGVQWLKVALRAAENIRRLQADER
jgi:hypothetical protein